MRTKIAFLLVGLLFSFPVVGGERREIVIAVIESDPVYLGDVETVDGSFFFGSWYEASFMIEGEVSEKIMRFTASSAPRKGKRIWAAIEGSGAKEGSRHVISDWGSVTYLECLMGMGDRSGDYDLDSFEYKIDMPQPWHCRGVSFGKNGTDPGESRRNGEDTKPEARSERSESRPEDRNRQAERSEAKPEPPESSP